MHNPIDIFDMATEKKGPRRLVTKAWRSAALDSMEKSGRTRKDVAESVGLSGPYLTMLVNGKYESSTKLDMLSKELGISVPESEASSPTVQKITDRANQLGEEQAQLALGIIENMIKSSKH